MAQKGEVVEVHMFDTLREFEIVMLSGAECGEVEQRPPFYLPAHLNACPVLNGKTKWAEVKH